MLPSRVLFSRACVAIATCAVFLSTDQSAGATGASTVASANVLAVAMTKSPTAAEPCREHAKVTFTLNAPVIDPKLIRLVKYTFVRSSGKQISGYHLFVDGETTIDVTDDWYSSEALAGTDTLRVTSPNVTESKADVTFAPCGNKPHASGTPYTVTYSETEFDIVKGSEHCRYDIDYHTKVHVSGWPSATHNLKWRALLTNGKIVAHTTLLNGSNIRIHSHWHEYAPFALTLKFQTTYPGDATSKDLNAHEQEC